MDEDRWAGWRAARPATDTLHLDTAAVGRASSVTLSAVADHARLEAQVGGYVAEERAAEQIDGLRRDLAGIVGTDADGVALVESATSALHALLSAWPLAEHARVGVAAAEWGPNLEVLAHHGLRIETLAVDGHGVLDLAALERRLHLDPLDLVLLDHAAAHRGLVQPAADVVALCRAAGVPVWVDGAQSIGQVPSVSGDALFATGRKWLCGPRGVGMLAVAEPYRDSLRVLRPAKHADLPPVRQLESGEAHVAGRVGLAVAVGEHLELGQARTAARLEDVGRRVRETVAATPGWEVLQPGAPAGSTTAVVATAGQDVVRARERLLREHAILTTVSLPWRAPKELEASGAPSLRISAHVDLTEDDLDRLSQALTQV